MFKQVYKGYLRYVKDVSLKDVIKGSKSVHLSLINHYRLCITVGKICMYGAHPCHVCLQCCHLVFVLIWLASRLSAQCLLLIIAAHPGTVSLETYFTHIHIKHTIHILTNYTSHTITLLVPLSSQNTKSPNLA